MAAHRTSAKTAPRRDAAPAAFGVPIPHCRLCAGPVRPLFSLGILASCGAFPRKGEADPPAGPLDMGQCAACGLVQLQHDFALESLFRGGYGYRSGLNESMIGHLAGIAEAAARRVGLAAGETVLDIGSNDGTLLSCYPAGVRLVGMDPTSARFAAFYPAGALRAADFFTAAGFAALVPGAQARIVTSIAMLYDLPDPNAFAADVAGVLAPDGVWITEQSYLPTMLARNAFDTICHEHLEYYGLAQIERLAARHGLRVIDARLNDVNGGSFQVWIAHDRAPYATNTAALETLHAQEAGLAAGEGGALAAFHARLQQARINTIGFLARQRAAGRVVHGYGASTKGNTLLQCLGVGPDLLPAIADRNPEKWGAVTPGSRIPIISEEDSRAARPDYYLALPWHFRDAFLARETGFLARGGRFVFPLPEFEIVSA